MKTKYAITLILWLHASLLLHAQFTPSGTDTYYSNGNVGIGTSTPFTRLQVSNGTDAALSNGGYITIGPSNWKNIVLDENEIMARRGNTYSQLYMQSEGGDIAFHSQQSNQRQVWIKHSGNVGIGTQAPVSRLHIKGGNDGTLLGGGSIVIGDPGAGNLLLDENEIMARENGTAGHLRIQNEGGAVSFHGYGPLDTRVIIASDGNLGIGTTNPSARIHIRGEQDASLTAGGAVLIGSPNGQNLVMDRNEIMARSSSGTGMLHLQQEGGAIAIHNQLSNDRRIRFTETGRLGLGTSNPWSKLDVRGFGRFGPNYSSVVKIGSDGSNGKIDFFGTSGNLILNSVSGKGVAIGRKNHPNGPSNLYVSGFITACNGIRSNEVWVRSDWCDYVFAPEYPLRTISELEDFINQNHHLPGILSADEIEREGLKLGASQKAMMEKIEELHLYVIQLKKENEALAVRLGDVEKELDENAK